MLLLTSVLCAALQQGTGSSGGAASQEGGPLASSAGGVPPASEVRASGTATVAGLEAMLRKHSPEKGSPTHRRHLFHGHHRHHRHHRHGPPPPPPGCPPGSRRYEDCGWFNGCDKGIFHTKSGCAQSMFGAYYQCCGARAGKYISDGDQSKDQTCPTGKWSAGKPPPLHATSLAHVLARATAVTMPHCACLPTRCHTCSAAEFTRECAAGGKVRSCLTCGKGKYCAGTGCTTCTACPAGKVESSNSDTSGCDLGATPRIANITAEALVTCKLHGILVFSGIF